MKTLLRHIVLTTVVGATALTCIHGKFVLAAPLPKKAVQGVTHAIEEFAPTLRKKGAEAVQGVKRSLGEKEGVAAASQRLEQREAEAALRQQTETEQQVSSLFKQTERGINDQLSANLVVLSEEKIQNIIREALAKAANDAAQQPTPKYSFNPLSGTLTFKKPWVMANGVEVKEINLYGTLAALDAAKSILECIKNKNVSECVADLLKSLENKLAFYSGSQINEE